MTEQTSVFPFLRWTAFLFAMVASWWQFLMVLLFLGTGAPWPGVLSAYGGALTLGYWYRALGNPSRPLRIGIWWLSLIMQGGFTVASVVEIVRWGFDPSGLVIWLWWWITTICSALFLWIEPPDPSDDDSYWATLMDATDSR